MGMIDRCLSYSISDKNLKFIINTLLENNYSPDFIFETINLSLKTLFHK